LNREKTTATLLIAIFMISTIAFTVNAVGEIFSGGGIFFEVGKYGIAELVTEPDPVHGGDYSVKLHMSDGTFALVGIPVEISLKEITSLSFYGIDEETTPSGHYFILWLDTTGNSKADVKLIGLLPIYSEEWKQKTLEDVLVWRRLWYQLPRYADWGICTLEAWQAGPITFIDDAGVEQTFDYSGADVLAVGVGISSADSFRTSYVDDFEINGEVYGFEVTTKAEVLEENGVPGKGIVTAPGLTKPIPNDNFAKAKGKK